MKRKKATSGVWYCGGMVSVLFVVAGCASHASVPPEVMNDLNSLRSAALTANSQIEKTVEALKDLVLKPQQNLKPQYDRFSYQLSELERVEASASAQRSATDKRIGDYFSRWDERIKALETEEMRGLGKERRDEGMASFKELNARITSLREAYQPFAKDLRDIQSYLGADLTTDGLAGIKPVTTRAIESETAILDRLNAVVTQIDSLMKTS